MITMMPTLLMIGPLEKITTSQWSGDKDPMARMDRIRISQTTPWKGGRGLGPLSNLGIRTPWKGGRGLGPLSSLGIRTPWKGGRGLGPLSSLGIRTPWKGGRGLGPHAGLGIRTPWKRRDTRTTLCPAD